jgi:hypothetical protein
MSFPFDLHSATMLDSHTPCRDHVVLKTTSHDHSTVRHGHGMAGARRFGRGSDYVTYVFVSLGSAVICGPCTTLTLSDQHRSL